MASRAFAGIVDVGVAFVIYLAIMALLSLAWDLLFSRRVDIPTPPGWFTGVAVFVVLVVYLALGWGSTGRTLGKQLMGLRVVRADTRPLGPRDALWRAFLCAVFHLGLLVALVHRRSQSLQDLICRTVVVYDWIPEAARPRVMPGRAPTASTGPSRESSA